MTLFSFVGEEWNVSQPPPLHKNLELAFRIKKINWDTKPSLVSQDCNLKTQDLKIINKFLILGDRTSDTKACVEGLSHWWYCGAPPPAWRIPRTTFTCGLVSRRARPQPAREGGTCLPAGSRRLEATMAAQGFNMDAHFFSSGSGPLLSHTDQGGVQSKLSSPQKLQRMQSAYRHSFAGTSCPAHVSLDMLWCAPSS